MTNELRTNSKRLILQGIELIQQKEFKKAINFFTQALILTPHSVEIHFYLGNAYTALKKWDQAIQYFKKIIAELNPEHAESHNNLGRIFHKQNEFFHAQKHYQKAIELNPQYLEAHFNMGLLWMNQQAWGNAKQQFHNILSWAEHNQLDTVYELLAQIELQEQHFETALQWYEKRLDSKKTLASQHLNNLGAIYTQLKDYDQAIHYFEKTLEVEPKHLEARNNLAALFLQKNALKEAIWHYKLYLSIAPKDAEIHYNLGVAFMLSGRLEEAINYFESAIQLAPQQGIDAWCNLGAIYVRLEKFQTAYDHYQKALTVDPHNEIAQFMIAALSQSHKILQEVAYNNLTVPSAAPLTYVRNLFDNYASHFEKHLSNTLDYQVPQKLYELIRSYLNNKADYIILDLGCGTGLSGMPFASDKKKLVGVDISANMLAEAEKKKIYDQLVLKDIKNFLIECKEHYDIIVSSDTFVYFGDLALIFEKAFEIANPKAYFLFSIEVQSEAKIKDSTSYNLQSNGRYQHQPHELLKLAEDYGWKKLDEKYISARLQKNQPVNALLVLLQKNTNHSRA